MARRKPQVAKVDANQGEIVETLRAVGLSVMSLAKVANGCPDIVVGWKGRNFLFEIKMPGKGLNEAEEAWHQKWQGQVTVVTSAKEVAHRIQAELPWSELTPALLQLALL